MAVLKTALNLAHEDGFTTSDHAWSSKLKPVKDANGRRDCYLDIGQRRALIAHAAPDLAVLVRAMSLLPMRPGAVAAFTVADFDKRLNALTIGQDKSGQDRKITLPASTAAFFAEQTKGKLPSAPLFARAGGSAWNKDSWKYPFKDAVTAAKLPPAATAYALRHSTITDLIVKGLDTLTVSQLAGTSIVMIEKHYGHLRAEHATKALEGLAL
jgi:integrase